MSISGPTEGATRQRSNTFSEGDPGRNSDPKQRIRDVLRRESTGQIEVDKFTRRPRRRLSRSISVVQVDGVEIKSFPGGQSVSEGNPVIVQLAVQILGLGKVPAEKGRVAIQRLIDSLEKLRDDDARLEELLSIQS